MVALVPATPALAPAAAAIARRWGLTCASSLPDGLCLVLNEQRLELRENGPDAPGPVFVDFVGGAVGHRRRYGGGRGQAIARAVGLKGGAAPRVLDATAGLGRDAFVLASLGCEVTLVERSAAVAALLENGLARAAAASDVAAIAKRMHLCAGDAAAYLAALGEDERPDVVYLDPMYPHREKSARVKKEMRLFRLLVGEDQDAAALLAPALAAARQRVVVKRPDYAEPLAGPRPTLSLPTKNHRFDIYVIKALRS